MNLTTLKLSLGRHEGRLPYAYTDSLGYLTIGVGHLIDQRRGGRLDDDVIDHQLTNDIQRAYINAQSYPWFVSLNDARQNVVVEMIFQLGTGGFAGFVGMHAALSAGDWTSASAHMLSSKWADQTPARAKELAAIMRTGELSGDA